ncbi:MAG: MarR family winged helix-turn-helix transcriptional regulator [Lachnospiraceae bacterium]|nr:MarR family winged helix-turn-helix transcriptional regulator [Lachnospiraceae bacterium]
MNNSGNEISKIAQIANRVSVRQMREAGLGTAEYDLLRLVKQQPGISQKDAGARLGMDKGALARRAVNLEQKGYLTRRSNPADARSQLLFPEPKTDQMDNAGASAEAVFYDWLLECLPDDEREQFCDVLHILEERARKESEDGFPNVKAQIQQSGPARSGSEWARQSASAELPETQPLEGAVKKNTADTQSSPAQNEPRQPKEEKQQEQQKLQKTQKQQDERKQNGQVQTTEQTQGETVPKPEKRSKRQDPDVWLL